MTDPFETSGAETQFKDFDEAFAFMKARTNYELGAGTRRFTPHLFAMRELVAALGHPERSYPAIHITGGLSNVSFGIPSRRIVNDAFMALSIDAGADGGIIDPTSGDPREVMAMDRSSRGFQLAEEMLLGKDDFCANFIAAWRNKEFK